MERRLADEPFDEYQALVDARHLPRSAYDREAAARTRFREEIAKAPQHRKDTLCDTENDRRSGFRDDVARAQQTAIRLEQLRRQVSDLVCEKPTFLPDGNHFQSEDAARHHFKFKSNELLQRQDVDELDRLLETEIRRRAAYTALLERFRHENEAREQTREAIEGLHDNDVLDYSLVVGGLIDAQDFEQEIRRRRTFDENVLPDDLQRVYDIERRNRQAFDTVVADRMRRREFEEQRRREDQARTRSQRRADSWTKVVLASQRMFLTLILASVFIPWREFLHFLEVDKLLTFLCTACFMLIMFGIVFILDERLRNSIEHSHDRVCPDIPGVLTRHVMQIFPVLFAGLASRLTLHFQPWLHYLCVVVVLVMGHLGLAPFLRQVRDFRCGCAMRPNTPRRRARTPRSPPR